MTRHLSPRLSVERLEPREVPATLYALTASNRLVQFDSSDPSVVREGVPIQSLIAGDRVVGIDFRPRTGELYGLVVNNANSLRALITSGRLVAIHPFTGATRTVGGSYPLAAGNITSAQFGFDFDPTADRIRVTSSTGLNLRLNPNDGSVTADTRVNPSGLSVGAAAYDRNFDGNLGTTGTTLYTINTATGELNTQGGVNQTPGPDTGTQFVVGPLGTPIDPNAEVGFDIAVDGTAYALYDATAGAGVTNNLYTVNLTTGAATLVGTMGPRLTGDYIGLAVAPDARFAVGSGAGEDSRVQVFDEAGNRLRTLNPFPGFFSGVTVGTADVTRDGVPDVIVGAGPGGGPHVKVYDGATYAEVYSFFAYADAFRGGVNVAAGDVNADGFADIITGAGAGGGPHVRVFSGQNLGELVGFFAYDPAFTGGVRVAAADFNTDGVDEVVTAAGAGGGPHVKVWNADGTERFGFMAYDAKFTGGVWVAAGVVHGDGRADVVTGADAGGGPHVKAFSGKDGAELAGFFAFDAGFTGGVRVGVGDVNRDGRVEVLTAPGSGLDSDVLAFDMNTGVRLRAFDVVDGTRGAYVGGGFA